MSKQIEAERLIKHMDDEYPENWDASAICAELRRLVSFNQQLMDEVARLKQAEQPEPLPVKTYCGGKAWHVAPEPDQQAAAVMPCGAVVSNVYEAYEAGKQAQPAREQLTDEEISKIAEEFWLYPRKFVRAIEAKLKEKNT